MDVMKSLKNLSVLERARLLTQLLMCDNDNQNNLDQSINSIQELLESKSPVKNSPSPRKKQKTLDEWLIKRNEISKTSVDQPSSHQATKSDFNKFPESETNSEVDTPDLTSNSSGNCNEESTIPSTSRLVEKYSTSNDLSPSGSKEDETDNLFSKKCASRSKRKVSPPSPVLECERNPKRVRRTCDKQDYLHNNNVEEDESNKLTDPGCTTESENIDKSEITVSNLISKKNMYNLRTKTKNSKLIQIDKASNSKLTAENNQTDIHINNMNSRSNNIVMDAKYDAFCKLNEICKEMSIDVLDILRDENVKSVLSDPKLLIKDAVVFIGSLRSNNGKISPIVHLAKSKKKLQEQLVSMQDKLSDCEPT